MTLPAPNLDDRQFQDLVDDAKRMVQRKWPEWTGWTDHNVSDPGVTLIETFAFMVDQLLYRVNQVTDLTYVKLLELIGIQLQPPTAASVPLTFWLSAPRPTDVIVPRGTEVSTSGGDGAEPLSFWTTRDLTITSSSLTAVASADDGQEAIDLTASLQGNESVQLFSVRPAPGDAFLVGLSDAVPSCVVTLRVSGDVEGYGIDPDLPPRTWEAWTGDTENPWHRCEILSDSTGGFNRPGDVVLQVPDDHRVTNLAGHRAGWLRCLVTEPDPDASAYEASPSIDGLRAYTIGGTVDSLNAQQIRDEILGTAEGVAGQEFDLAHRPVVLQSERESIEVVTEVVDSSGETSSSVEAWTRVDTFPDDTTDGRCFVLDPMNGTVRLPPAVRDPDGSARFYGHIPPAGAVLRIASYLTGGGRIRRVAPGAVSRLKTSIPGIGRVENRVDASGGIDGESVDEAKRRGPLELRARHRAVTATDYEYLSQQAAQRDLARVRCVDLGSQEPGAVRLLLVPNVVDGPEGRWRLAPEQLIPAEGVFRDVTEKLNACRVVGVRLAVELPVYQGLTVIARLRAHRRFRPAQVQEDALDALYRYYHPVSGGPEGDGWPFGRPLLAGEVYAVLRDVPGVDVVDEALLYTYDLGSQARGQQPATRIELGPNDLVFSFAHRVQVEQSL